jgi:hypothetical protein
MIPPGDHTVFRSFLRIEQLLTLTLLRVKHIVADEEAAYNFKMNSEKHVLYREAQPDLDYEFAMAGVGVIELGVENMKIDDEE